MLHTSEMHEISFSKRVNHSLEQSMPTSWLDSVVNHRSCHGNVLVDPFFNFYMKYYPATSKRHQFHVAVVPDIPDLGYLQLSPPIELFIDRHRNHASVVHSFRGTSSARQRRQCSPDY